MSLPALLEGRLSIPVVASPLFISSGPDLVVAQCQAGVVGSFPALNARPAPLLGDWLDQVDEQLRDFATSYPERPVAPYVAAGAGGHAGTQSPFALVQEIRRRRREDGVGRRSGRPADARVSRRC